MGLYSQDEFKSGILHAQRRWEHEENEIIHSTPFTGEVDLREVITHLV